MPEPKPSYTMVRPEKLSQLKYSPVDAANMQFDRAELFKELRAHIKKRYPNFHLEYGYCNPKFDLREHLLATMAIEAAEKVNQRFIMIDYCLVYSYMDAALNNTRCAFIVCPAIASSRSLNTMALYKYQGKLEEFWNDYFISSIRFPFRVLEDYLYQHHGLEASKEVTRIDRRTMTPYKEDTSALWWKNPANKEKAVIGISECCAEFQPDKH